MPLPNVQIDPNSIQPLSGAVATPQSTGTSVSQAPQAVMGLTNLPDKAPTPQGAASTGQGASAQSPSTASTSTLGNIQIDPNSIQPLNGESAATSDGTDHPTETSRIGETSGITGALDLGKQILERPVDLLTQAIDQAQNSDWKGAIDTASKLIFGVGKNGLDKESPIYKAAEQIVMHPVNAIAEQYKEARKNGMNPLAATVSTTLHTLSATPNDTELGTGVERVESDLSKSDFPGVVGDVAGTLMNSKGANSIPVFGGQIAQVGGNLDEDLHAHNYHAAVGDVLGPLLTLGLGKIFGVGEDTTGIPPPPKAPTGLSAAIEGARPTRTTIAGIKVPQASETPFAQNVAALASEKAAKDFVARQVQPAARAALQSNFAKSALSDVDSLRASQGASNTSIVPPKSPLFDLDATGKFLKDEAQVTYKKADAAAESDINEWKELEKEAKEQDAAATEAQNTQSKNNPSSGAAIPPKPITTAQDALPPKPLKFTQLQDLLRRTKAVIESKNPSIQQVDREQAIKNYPKYKQQMEAFLEKHEDDFGEGELDQANLVRAKATRYGWLANKVRTATKGLGAGADAGATGKAVGISETSLDNIPAQFDNKYGAGAFDKLVGPEGRANYNAVVKALQTPATGGRLLDWLNSLRTTQFLGSKPVNALTDNLLFNPQFGSTAVRAYQLQQKARTFISNAARGAGKAGVIATPETAPSSAPPNTGAADAARQALSQNPKKGKPLTALTDNNPSTSASSSPNSSTDIPTEVRNAVTTIPVEIKQGQSIKDPNNRGGGVPIANVDQGAGNNTIEVNRPQDFGPAQKGHELVHIWQNNLPPSVQAKIPDDPKDTSAFDISDADKLRKQGKTLVDIPREKAATIVQKYIEDPKKNANLKPWIEDMGKHGLSITQPTAPNATRLNTNPRAPGLPSGVAGMR